MNRDSIKKIDQYLEGGEGRFGDGAVDLKELSKTKTRAERELQEEREEVIAEKERQAEKEKDIKEYFIDSKGNQYDPDKKFGIITDENALIYDNVTTSYEVNLPPDYYLKYISEALPN